MIELPKWNQPINFACALCSQTITVKFRARAPSAFCHSCIGRIIRQQKQWGDKHRESQTPLYRVWSQMRYRCHKPKHANYPEYGGRGIYVCDLWRQDYRHFATWARANGYQKGLYLDRRDNDGPYSPDNCQWSTPKEQTYNKRTRQGHLSVEQAKVIRAAAAAGASFAEIRLKYRVTQRTLLRLLKGETFARFIAS